ncbi:MAG TPA: radical SAM protein [bacterium]|nr:radical SAM protein [bacterium]
MSQKDTTDGILDIKITYNCNNLCRFCEAGDKRKTFGDGSEDGIKKVLSENRETYDRLVFSGGEPTLHRSLPELVRFAKHDLEYDTVQIRSNGRMFIYRDYCEKIIEAGAGRFAISVHGHCSACHDFLTGRKDSFVETVGGIRNLLELGQTVETRTVITKPNYRHLPEIAGLLISLNVRRFVFSYPNIAGTCERNVESIVPWMSLASPYVKKALDIAGSDGRLSLAEAIPACMLAGFEDYIAGEQRFVGTVMDGSGAADDFSGHGKKSLKEKGPGCPGCRRFDRCEGVWPDYPVYFGWEEFEPLK